MPRDRTEVRIESNDFSCSDVHVTRLRGSEIVSQLFSFELEITVPPDAVDPETLPNAELDIVFERAGAELRRIHGTITAVDDLLDTEPTTRAYRLTVHPRAHWLTRIATQEVFLDRTIPEIIQEKLSLVGLEGSDVEFRLMEAYPKREFVLQFQETDLAFISRLAEHLGIAFFFEQHDGRDRLVFSDHPAGFHSIQRDDPVVFRARGEVRDVHHLESHKAVMPSTWIVQDYNYRIPHVDLTESHEVSGERGGGVVEYGGNHKTPEEGRTLARIRAEERQAATSYYRGESDLCELAAGATFVLTDHPRFEGGKELLVVEVHHEVTQVTGLHGGADATDYKNAFRAVDAARGYRPPRITPKPRVHGVLTGWVEPRADGRLGKVATLDEHGRYTVRFCFDAEPVGSRRHSSHHVRMLQHHVGPNYGTHLPLKAGVEVMLAFVGGDPDRPVIVGAVPNPATPSPVTGREPDTHRIKTASGILIQMRDHFRSS